MKTRDGFVSNSSSASFCIYGWTDGDLGLSEWEANDLCRWLRDILPSMIDSPHPHAGTIIGVGNVAEEMDHGEDEPGAWRDYRCDEPTKEDMAKLDEIALGLGLPKPTISSATWFNG